MEKSNETIKRAANLIKSADFLIFTNGAGLGVDSGLSTFRGRNEEKIGWAPIESGSESAYSMAKPRRVDEDPDLAWGYATYRYNTYKQSEPHAGYHIMMKWGESKNLGYAVYTSNIDGHWKRVLPNTTPLVEFHGSVDYMQCHRNCADLTWETDDHYVKSTLVDAQTGRSNVYPSCPYCQDYARFNVFLVADGNFNDARKNEQTQKWDAFIAKLSKCKCNVVVVEVGAGTGIPTIRRKSAELTRTLGAKLVRINLDDAELDRTVDIGHLIMNNMHVSIGGLGALEALTKIDEEIEKN